MIILVKYISRGFTLIEMLVVVGIIAIIAIASINGIRGSVAEARDQKRYKDLDTIEAALYSFYTQNGQFPNTGGVWHTICSNGSHSSAGVVTPNYIPGLAPDFISSLPTDPSNCNQPSGWFNGYIYRSNGTDFKIATDWSTEEGELCDEPSDKYWDENRGTSLSFAGNWFCSLSSPDGDMW